MSQHVVEHDLLMGVDIDTPYYNLENSQTSPGRHEPSDEEQRIVGAYSPLRFAAYTGNIAVLDMFLRTPGVHVNEQDINMSTALHISAVGGHWKTVKYLLRRGADGRLKNKRGNTALMDAVSFGRVSTVKAFCEAGVDLLDPYHSYCHMGNMLKPGSLLMNAVSYGHLPMVELLVEKGFDIDGICKLRGVTAIFLAAKMGNNGIVEYLIKRGARLDTICKNQGSALHACVVHEDTETMRLLLDAGASIDATNNRNATVLHLAVRCNESGPTKLLLQRGANMFAADICGFTPVHYACIHWDLPFKAMLEHGMNIETRHGVTMKSVLNHAADAGNAKVVGMLLRSGVKVDSHGVDGNTALHSVAETGDGEIVQNLLQHNANIYMRNEVGATPMAITLARQITYPGMSSFFFIGDLLRIRHELNQEKDLAFAMMFHKRLGHGSTFDSLDADMAQTLARPCGPHLLV